MLLKNLQVSITNTSSTKGHSFHFHCVYNPLDAQNSLPLMWVTGLLMSQNRNLCVKLYRLSFQTNANLKNYRPFRKTCQSYLKQNLNQNK